MHPGQPWTPELAVEMLCDVGLLDRALAESEVTRYLGWPAQAISYKIGEKAILDLRDARAAAASRAGEPFDRISFHSDVLRVGAVGLDLLAEVVAPA